MDETSDKAHADEVRGAEEALTPQPATDLTAQEASAEAPEAPAEAASQPTPEAPEPTDPLEAVYQAAAKQWHVDLENPFVRRVIAAKVEGDRELVELRRAAELREASRKPEPPKPAVTPPAQPRIPFHVLRGLAQDAARRIVSDDAAAALAPPLYNAFSERTAALEMRDGKEKSEALREANRFHHGCVHSSGSVDRRKHLLSAAGLIETITHKRDCHDGRRFAGSQDSDSAAFRPAIWQSLSSVQACWGNAGACSLRIRVRRDKAARSSATVQRPSPLFRFHLLQQPQPRRLPVAVERLRRTFSTSAPSRPLSA
jgi:hypothetical protein